MKKLFRLFGINRWMCWTCGCRFEFNIDGCPNCGSQDLGEALQ
jgi:rubrerythrin